MIPIAAIPNLPLTDGLGAGVELLPDGLTFFKPATLDGVPVAVYLSLLINFSLQ